MEKPRTLLRPDGSVAFPHPNRTVFDDFPIPRRWFRWVKSIGHSAGDWDLPVLRHWLTPLEMHVVICGYHRSGTTLMQAMLAAAYPDARVFDDEVGAWRAAIGSRRNHRLMVSKAPQDVCRITQIRNLYRNRNAKVRFLVMTRDPRDVLTSQQPTIHGYCHHISDWRVLHAFAMKHRNDPDVMHLPYEQLVDHTDAVKDAIARFIGFTPKRCFRDFYKHMSPTFAVRTLSGTRPVERSKIGRWAQPQHARRIEEVLRTVPGFTDLLIDLGYESHRGWEWQWRKSLVQSKSGAFAAA